MSDLSFGRRYSRGFQKFYDVCHLAAGGIAVLLLFMSMMSKDNAMKYFPMVFLDAAALNFVCAYANLKTSYRQRHQKASGLGYLLLGVLFLALTAAVAVCVW